MNSRRANPSAAITKPPVLDEERAWQRSPRKRRLLTMLLATIVLSAILPTAAAQLRQLPQIIDGQVPPAELTPPQLPVVSGTAAARLQQLSTLIANDNWDDAIDALNEIVQTEPARIDAVGDDLYINTSKFRNREIARWPAKGLAHFRSRVDALAERHFRDGLAARDEQALVRVLDDAFCSSWGDDSLFAMGEIALERADYASARRYWSQILPRQDAQGALIHYPDTNLDPAAIRARLALVSIREGNLALAQLELAELRRLHPNSSGRLAGKETPFVPALEQLLAAARDWPSRTPASDWPTFAGASDRNRVLPTVGPLIRPAWMEPLQLPRVVADEFPTTMRMQAGVEAVPIQRVQTPDKSHALQPVLAHFPVAANGRVYFANELRVSAVNLTDGKPAVTASGVIYNADATARPREESGQQRYTSDAPHHSLSLIGDTLYTRVGPVETARIAGRLIDRAARLVGLSLPREGLLTFIAVPDDKSWAFDGVPVGDDRKLFVAMRRSDVNPQAAVACFDTTGRELWRTSVGSANTNTSGIVDEITHNLLTFAGDRIYFQSNLGFVASLRTSDGKIEWLRTYPRGRNLPAAPQYTPLAIVASTNRPPSPALFDRGRLYLAPTDAVLGFALEADSGRVLWTSKELVGASNLLGNAQLLGVVDDTLVCAGGRLNLVDVQTGRVRATWPTANLPAASAAGRGLVAGHEVFYPTAKEIYVIDVRTGQPSRPPISLASIGEQGANLILADGYLVAAGPELMTAFKIESTERSN